MPAVLTAKRPVPYGTGLFGIGCCLVLDARRERLPCVSGEAERSPAAVGCVAHHDRAVIAGRLYARSVACAVARCSPVHTSAAFLTIDALSEVRYASPLMVVNK